MAVCLTVVLNGCSIRDGAVVIGGDSPPGTLIVRDAPDVFRAIGTRCNDVATDSDGDFEGVFDEEWDRITFANSKTTFREIADETGAPFDERLFDRSPRLGVVVLQLNGRAIAAYQTEDPPFELSGGAGMVSMDAPGVFTNERGFCIIEP